MNCYSIERILGLMYVTERVKLLRNHVRDFAFFIASSWLKIHDLNGIANVIVWKFEKSISKYILSLMALKTSHVF